MYSEPLCLCVMFLIFSTLNGGFLQTLFWVEHFRLRCKSSSKPVPSSFFRFIFLIFLHRLVLSHFSPLLPMLTAPFESLWDHLFFFFIWSISAPLLSLFYFGISILEICLCLPAFIPLTGNWVLSTSPELHARRHLGVRQILLAFMKVIV